MPEQVGYRRSAMRTWLLLRRVRVCRILVPEASAETKRNMLLKGSGSSDALLFGLNRYDAWASLHGYRRLTMLTWLLLRRVRVCRLCWAPTHQGVASTAMVGCWSWPVAMSSCGREAIMRLASRAYFWQWIGYLLSVTELSVACSWSALPWRKALTVHGEELTKWRRWCTTSLPAVTSLLLCNHLLGRTHVHLSPGKARLIRRASRHRKTKYDLQANNVNTGYAWMPERTRCVEMYIWQRCNHECACVCVCVCVHT